MASLHADPHWLEAAQALIEGCVDLPNDEDRVALLVAVCDGLGNDLYPAFLRVLWLIGRQGDHGARAAVARALVHALRTGRLPSGRRQAWGGGLAPGHAFGATRLLGPLEFVCAWHAQGVGAEALPAADFESAAGALMDLVSASPQARALYCEKLIAEVDDPLGGALARPTRAALRALALAWQAGQGSAQAAAEFAAALRGAAGGSLAALATQRPVPVR